MSDNDFMALFFPEVFVKKIEIKEIMPCTVEADGIKFVAQADRTIDEILSILYLVIPNAKFFENRCFNLQNPATHSDNLFKRKNKHDPCKR